MEPKTKNTKNPKKAKEQIEISNKMDTDTSTKPNEPCINNRSIINMKGNEPIGLDMNEFSGGNTNNEMDIDDPLEFEKVNDMDLINDIHEQQQTFLGVINKRSKSLKLLLKFWGNDINSAINGLAM